jgi:hypothetical protein
MNKKLLLLALLSIVQSNFCMDVVPKPQLVLCADGHWWTQIGHGDPVAASFLDVIVAWESDDISGKGLKLEGHPNHCFGTLLDEDFAQRALALYRVSPSATAMASSLTVRLLTCAEARSWMRSPHTQPSAGVWEKELELTKLKIENLMPSERIKYLRCRAFEKCFPERSVSERKSEAVSLLALKRRGGNLVAQCPKEIVRLMVEPLFDAWVHRLQVNKDPEMLPGALLVFEDKK